jgi:hypothetical protein
MNNTRRQLPEYSNNNPLRTWMTEQGLGCADLAERVGVCRALIWQFASGKRKVTDGFRWQFSEVYGFKTAIAVLGVSNDPPPTPKAQP